MVIIQENKESSEEYVGEVDEAEGEVDDTFLDAQEEFHVGDAADDNEEKEEEGGPSGANKPPENRGSLTAKEKGSKVEFAAQPEVAEISTDEFVQDEIAAAVAEDSGPDAVLAEGAPLAERAAEDASPVEDTPPPEDVPSPEETHPEVPSEVPPEVPPVDTPPEDASPEVASPEDSSPPDVPPLEEASPAEVESTKGSKDRGKGRGGEPGGEPPEPGAETALEREKRRAREEEIDACRYMATIGQECFIIHGKDPWPKDVKLYQPYEVEQILLPDNANCLAVQAFLKMCKLDYSVTTRANAEAMSPSGKLPFIKCGAFVVSELEGIVQFVNSKGITLTDDLDKEQKADMRAYMSLIHNVLENAESYICWLDNETYKQVTKPRTGSIYPFPLNHLKTYEKRSAEVKRLKQLGWASKSLEDVYKEVENCCQALTDRLENNQFFFGKNPTEFDALCYAHLHMILTSNTPADNNELAFKVHRYEKLVKFCERVDRDVGNCSRYSPQRFCKANRAGKGERPSKDDDDSKPSGADTLPPKEPSRTSVRDAPTESEGPTESSAMDSGPMESGVPTESEGPTEIAEADESGPPESAAPESAPTESAPTESTASESVPGESAPSESVPAESTLSESAPTESAASESAPESAPTETSESAPTESEPAAEDPESLKAAASATKAVNSAPKAVSSATKTTSGPILEENEVLQT